MSSTTTATTPPEHNVTGIDYAERGHLRYAGPALGDAHAHVMLTRPSDPPTGPPVGIFAEFPFAKISFQARQRCIIRSRKHERTKTRKREYNKKTTPGCSS